MDPNKDIVNYTDYRAFLSDYYHSRKKKMTGFSYKVMAERAGFSSASFQRMVIEGEKNLSSEGATKMAGAMKLNKKSTEYFEYIVAFTQAKDIETKELYLEKIDRYRKKNKPELLLGKEYNYLKEWFHVVIREMVEFAGFSENAKTISSRLNFALSQDDIEKSLSFLEEYGFLIRDKSGKLRKAEKTISTVDIPDNEELILIAKRYHLSMIELAAKSVTALPREKRNINNTTISMSQKSYDLAIKRIENLRYEMLELAAADDQVDRICQLNINFFTIAEDHE